MANATIERHSLTVRIVHWSVALSGLVLIFSGFGELPMYQRYMLTEVPGFGWAGNFSINLVIHYLAAIVFSAAVLFHAVYHLRRREWAVFPKRGDLRESLLIIKAMISGKEEPPHGKFLAEQRLAYLAIAGVTTLLLLTGMIKTWKNTDAIILPSAFLQSVTLIHTLMAMAFAALIVAHLAAFVLKANRPLLPSMFSGKVPSSYAHERHPLWVAELKGVEARPSVGKKSQKNSKKNPAKHRR